MLCEPSTNLCDRHTKALQICGNADQMMLQYHRDNDALAHAMHTRHIVPHTRRVACSAWLQWCWGCSTLWPRYTALSNHNSIQPCRQSPFLDVIAKGRKGLQSHTQGRDRAGLSSKGASV